MKTILLKEQDIKRMFAEGILSSCSIYKENNLFKLMFFDTSGQSTYSILMTKVDKQKSYSNLQSAYQKLKDVGLNEFNFWDKDWRTSQKGDCK